MKAKISEVFDSFQGEGLYLGERQIFVRFYGCNLNCSFCDTKINHFSEYDVDELAKKIDLISGEYHPISFTGGEPLLQKNFLKEITKVTKKKGYANYLETNGTMPEALEDLIDNIDIIAMDLKFPSSTGLKPLWKEHREFFKIASSKEMFLKAVICSSSTEEDLQEAIDLIKEVNQSAILVLQPNSNENHGKLNEKMDMFRNICSNGGVVSCVIPQVHKITGDK